MPVHSVFADIAGHDVLDVEAWAEGRVVAAPIGVSTMPVTEPTAVDAPPANTPSAPSAAKP